MQNKINDTVNNKTILDEGRPATYLQCLPFQSVNNLYGRSRIKYGMTALFNTPSPALWVSSSSRERASSPWRGNLKGFTLIELLV
ncbi:MAG: hypothetical protein J6Q05_03725, partial [Elusimicrobiaceae bacterium]|nr:hypothetical protein [Elusimicrobiaceae bacterium]